MRAPRACATPGCPAVVTSGHCSTHARPGPRARGYDRAHDKLRARIDIEVRAGYVYCWRCTRRIDPTEPWDLGHDDHDRTVYRGPEHLHCNRSAAGKAAHLSPDQRGEAGQP
jgi:hypothetical protein